MTEQEAIAWLRNSGRLVEVYAPDPHDPDFPNMIVMARWTQSGHEHGWQEVAYTTRLPMGQAISEAIIRLVATVSRARGVVSPRQL